MGEERRQGPRSGPPVNPSMEGCDEDILSSTLRTGATRHRSEDLIGNARLLISARARSMSCAATRSGILSENPQRACAPFDVANQHGVSSGIREWSFPERAKHGRFARSLHGWIYGVPGTTFPEPA